MSDRKEEFAVGTAPQLDLRISSGRIALAEAPAGTITVEVSGPQASDFVIEQRGDAITVRQPRSRLLNWRTHDVVITMPPRSDLNADLASAELIGTVDLGLVDIKTASGQVDLRAATGGRIKSASGNVMVRSATEKVSVVTASGSASLGDVVAFDASTASGDVMIESVSGPGQAKTVSGDIRIDVASGESIKTKTVSGDIRIAVPTGRAIDVDVRSLSGKVRLPSEPDAGSTRSDANMEVAAQSVSGDVELLTLR